MKTVVLLVRRRPACENYPKRGASQAGTPAYHSIFRAKLLAESICKYVNPYNGKKLSVMLRTDYDEEVMRLPEAVGRTP